MKTKIIILGCLLLVNSAVQAETTLPQGRWTVEKISIEKNTDGIVQTAVYKTAAEVISYIACPREWEINERSIVLRYPDGKEETIAYIIEGDRLTMLEDSIVPYLYSVNDNNLILTTATAYIYANELPGGNTERTEEKWIITLKKLD